MKQYVVAYKFGRQEQEQYARFARLDTARIFVRELKRYDLFRWATVTEQSITLIESIGVN